MAAQSEQRPRVAGLKWRPRKGGDVPYWFAPREAVAKGFKPASMRLHHAPGDDAALVTRCHQLNAEAAMFLAGRPHQQAFDLTFGALLKRYLTDPESSYRALKPSSSHPYTIYAARLKEHIGEVRIDLTDGRDVQRWFRIWAGVDHLDGNLRDPLKAPEARLPRAHAMLAVLKAAISFGIVCRLPACVEFKTVLGELEFPSKKPRSFAPTAAQIEAARAAAHAAGAPSRALAYAIQFETTLRQWDVTGIWVPLSDPRPSAIIDGNKKWIGPTWAMVDGALVLRLQFGKTEDTSALRGTYDLSACPMVMAELQRIARQQSGPLIVNEKTGLPYQDDQFLRGWKADFKAAGLPAGMWNRDFRAGAITESGLALASEGDDFEKVTGHTTKKQIAQVYDRNALEAHRRLMAKRAAGREGVNVRRTVRGTAEE